MLYHSFNVTSGGIVNEEKPSDIGLFALAVASWVIRTSIL